jgi:hypothetical protein
MKHSKKVIIFSRKNQFAKEEIAVLVIGAKEMGISKFVLTHPLNIEDTSLDVAFHRELAEKAPSLNTVSCRPCGPPIPLLI